jgi:hypothetical protein
MKPLTIGIAAAGAILVAMVALFRSGHEQSVRGKPSTQVAKVHTSENVPHSNGGVSGQRRPATGDPLVVRPNYADNFKKSQNYLMFVQSTVAAARSGDRDAQYYLGKALAFCDETYQTFFRRQKRQLSLDEALQYSVELHRSRDLTRSIYERCHDLKDRGNLESEFGKSSDWIGKAADAGQPVAQATTALLELQRTQLKATGFADASSVVHVASDTDPHTLLMAAVESKDPEALWYVGTAQGLLNHSYDEAMKNQYAWWLVSCEHGMDCSPGADWIQMSCLDECGLSGPDYIRMAAGDKWQEVEQRAQEISEKLDAGESSQLGLGS